MKTIEKISSLREQMRKYSLAAYIVPGTDPHASEYVTEHWRERMWISGFTGSAGTAMVDCGLIPAIFYKQTYN